MMALVMHDYIAGLIIGLCPANVRRRYFVTTSLIGCVQAYDQACITTNYFSVNNQKQTVTHSEGNGRMERLHSK